MAFPSVPPNLASPKLVDKIVQNLKDDFAANLSWLQSSFPLVYVGVAEEDEKGEYPQLYANDGTRKHYDLRPDNKQNSFGFFELIEEIPNTEEDLLEARLAWVFWGRLDKMFPAKNYDYTQELIGETLDRLDFWDAGPVDIQRNPEDVFARYSGLTQLKDQHLMKTYTGFRLEFDIIDTLCT